MRGWASVGFGVVSLRQEMVLTKKQSLVSQAICVGFSSTSSSEGSAVSLPISRAAIWSAVIAQAHFHAGARAVPGVDSGEPDGGSARVVADAVAKGVGLQVGQVAHHVDLVAEGGERLEDGGRSAGSGPGVFGNHCS